MFQCAPSDFIGTDTHYGLADGRITRRHYLDSAATTLAMRTARQMGDEWLHHAANTHSTAHFSARIAQQTADWAHQQLLQFVGASTDHVALFAGSGCTALINRLARILAAQRPERDVVLVSLLEHHANDLPHRQHARRVIHIPLIGKAPALGTVDLDALSALLAAHHGHVNYIAISAASNVTGICQPINEMTALAHAAGAHIIVDASQLLAHAPFDIGYVDAVVFSGHKLYAPGSPGVAVVRKSLLAEMSPDEFGGGMVDDVSISDYHVTTRWPDREEAGTPNLVGAVELATAVHLLQRMGMTTIHAAEQHTLRTLMDGLSDIPGMRIYGDVDRARTPRVGTVAFNLAEIPHGLVAAVLNDYHNVAVRNGCFCAHPYVRALLQPELWALDIDPDAPGAMALIRSRQGMVRASVGLYTTEADIAALLTGLEDLRQHADDYRVHYDMDANGGFHHRRFDPNLHAFFDPTAIIEQ